MGKRTSWSGRDSARWAPLVVETYGATCWLCGQPISMSTPRTEPLGLSLDHVIPRARGGENTLENLRPAHLHCNRQRGMRTSFRSSRAPFVASEWPAIGSNRFLRASQDTSAPSH